MQHYVIKFVSDLWQVGSFLRVLRFPPQIIITPFIITLTVQSGTEQKNRVQMHLFFLLFPCIIILNHICDVMISVLAPQVR